MAAVTRGRYPARHGRPRSPWPGEQEQRRRPQVVADGRAWGLALVAFVVLFIVATSGILLALVLAGPDAVRWVQP